MHTWQIIAEMGYVTHSSSRAGPSVSNPKCSKAELATRPSQGSFRERERERERTREREREGAEVEVEVGVEVEVEGGVLV